MTSTAKYVQDSEGLSKGVLGILTFDNLAGIEEKPGVSPHTPDHSFQASSPRKLTAYKMNLPNFIT